MRERRHFRTDWCYHLISRIAHRAFFLTEDERTRFVDLLRRAAAFPGVEVLAYCFMTNHFHILVYVPPPRELSDGELIGRIRALYRGPALARIEEEWTRLVASGTDKGRAAFRRRFTRRMWDTSEFMKTLKQYATVSFNGRRMHTGTMWESRFRVREYAPDEKVALMAVAAYIDRNPIKAKLVSRAEDYPWCGFAAACGGDARCMDGYRFIYTFAPLEWPEIRTSHEKSIAFAVGELEDEGAAGKARSGLSVDEERREKANARAIGEFESRMPDRVPRILGCGNERVTADVLRQLSDGPKRPAELRAALGIRSANFFTARYLSPLEKAGLIRISGKADRFSPHKLFELTARGRRLANGQPHH